MQNIKNCTNHLQGCYYQHFFPAKQTNENTTLSNREILTKLFEKSNSATNNIETNKLSKTKNILSTRNFIYAGAGLLIFGVPLAIIIAKGGFGTAQENNVIEPCLTGETDITSLFKRGQIYEKRNEIENAATCYTMAADQGHAEAQNTMGFWYLDGMPEVKETIIPYSKENAIKYFKMAAAQCSAKGPCSPGSIEAYFLLAQLEDNVKEAGRLYKIAADHGYAPAQYEYAYHCKGDQNVKNADAEVIKYFKLAADQGDEHAQLELAHIYEKGLHAVGQSYKEAIKYYKMIVSSSNLDTTTPYHANYALGRLYEEGKGVTQSYSEAVNYYKKAEVYHIDARLRLAEIYMYGKKGVPQSYETAFQYYNLITSPWDKHPNTNVLYKIGNMYEKGQGIFQSNQLACDYYFAAAHKGDKDALNAYSRLSSICMHL